MDPHWNDDAVSRLPITAGRAELLEEIMSTDVDHARPDRPAVTALSSRHRRWLVPAASAAAVVALAVGVVGLSGDERPDSAPAPPATQPTDEPTAGHLALLDDPAWTFDDVDGSLTDGEGEVEYVQGARNLLLQWGPASTYADIYENGVDAQDDPDDGRALDVAGAPATLWSYGRDDHLVVREVTDGFWLAVRGEGMSAADTEALLPELRLVDTAAFESAMPARYVTSQERPAVVEEMLAGIVGASGASLPDGVDAPTSEQPDRYHVAAEVAGGYACAWVEELVTARDAGDAARRAVAVDVLDTARTWPVLQEFADEDGFVDVYWQIIDESLDGTPPPEWRQGMC